MFSLLLSQCGTQPCLHLSCRLWSELPPPPKASQYLMILLTRHDQRPPSHGTPASPHHLFMRKRAPSVSRYFSLPDGGLSVDPGILTGLGHDPSSFVWCAFSLHLLDNFRCCEWCYCAPSGLCGTTQRLFKQELLFAQHS